MNSDQYSKIDQVLKIARTYELSIQQATELHTELTFEEEVHGHQRYRCLTCSHARRIEGLREPEHPWVLTCDRYNTLLQHHSAGVIGHQTKLQGELRVCTSFQQQRFTLLSVVPPTGRCADFRLREDLCLGFLEYQVFVQRPQTFTRVR